MSADAHNLPDSRCHDLKLPYRQVKAPGRQTTDCDATEASRLSWEVSKISLTVALATGLRPTEL